MTNHQDKELSRVIDNLMHAFWMHCRMSAVEFENLSEVKAARAVAASPQLPVAQMSGDDYAWRLKEDCWQLCDRDTFLSNLWSMGIGFPYECAARKSDGTGILYRDGKPSDLLDLEKANTIFGAASHPSNAATVPQVVQAPSGFNVQSTDFAGLQTAIKIIKSIDDGEAPEYMACIEAIQSELTTASNAGEAAQGADK